MKSISEFIKLFVSGSFKQRCNTTTIIILYFVILTSTAYANPPYTFSSGQTAKSSEVNANFAYVNYGNIVLKDGNGNEVGSFVGSSDAMAMVLNSNGYLFELVMDPPGNRGQVRSQYIYFSSDNCTGTAYIDGSNFSGTVVSDGSGHLYYAAKNVLPATITYSSDYFNGCSNGSHTVIALPALPNDTSVTGIPSLSFTLPLSVGRR
ncbi:hypothetical protein [Candidatus Magnetominusculus dajiuhuensis]|uniref:hypothetical protein n=1 Tax=Candidatus Magnetominusculus dajiuhuensis TaxID=3137712 RepID=UPI003B436B92